MIIVDIGFSEFSRNSGYGYLVVVNMFVLSNSQKFITAIRYYYPDVPVYEKDLEDAFENFLKGFPDLVRANIKKLRERSNISQRELAKKLNITQSSYSGWETGAHTPKVDNLIQMAELLEFDPYEFIGDYPFKNKSTYGISVPIFDTEFFLNKRFNKFSDVVYKADPTNASEFGVKGFRPSTAATRDSFVFYNKSEDMLGVRNFIPANCMVYCNYAKIQGKSRLEKMAIANEKVALVSVNQGAPILRQVIFDSNTLTLRAWNDKVGDLVFPVTNMMANAYSSQRNTMVTDRGDIILADEVELYGIAYEYVKELDSDR